MITHVEFDVILNALRHAHSLHDLSAVMAEFCKRIGFEQYALGHHVDLVNPPRDAVRLTNYHPDWIEQSLEHRFFADDPVHATFARLSRPFVWHEMDRHITLTASHERILDKARGYGLATGITIPVRMTGEYEGTCSFAARTLDGLHPFALPMATLAANFAFESARKIMRKAHGGPTRTIPHLTTKQKETLILVGRGKTDAEIGDVLGISRTTAHDHVEAGRRAYGNSQRTLAVLRAIYDGVISFADIFRH